MLVVRVDLTPDQLRAVVAVVGAKVSETGEEHTPLEQAERALDSALLRHEEGP